MWSYRVEYTRCGKRCRGCPHGPYWYRYQRLKGQLVKEYVGVVIPEKANAFFPEAAAGLDWRLPVLDRVTVTPDLCRRVLDLPLNYDARELRARWLKIRRDLRNPKGEELRELAFLSCAYSYLKLLIS